LSIELFYVLNILVLPCSQILRAEQQAYLCHPGSQSGQTCTFVLQSPPRSRCLPYAHLLAVDILGDRLITIRYSFADVEISLGRDFPGRQQFLDDLAALRVALVRDGPQVRIRIIAEPFTEKSETF
jgi:hypothetical protein